MNPSIYRPSYERSAALVIGINEYAFILITPKNQHMVSGTPEDFLVKTVGERPESVQVVPNSPVKFAFAEKSGYGDQESDTFGHNQWSKYLGIIRNTNEPSLGPASHWLSLVVEPVSNESIRFDIGSLAQSLPTSRCGLQNPWDQLLLPSQPGTTAKSLILFEPQASLGEEKRDYWKRFLRIEKDGPIEYCNSMGVARVWVPSPGTTEFKIFKYVQMMGTIWSFLYSMKRIFGSANYLGGVRIIVNLVGTQGSLLCEFAQSRGPGGNHWLQPFDHRAMMRGSLNDWTCQDKNLQFTSKFVLASFGDGEAKRLIAEYADFLGLAYNHRSKPRCFINGTDELPWNEFSVYEA